MIIFIWYGDAGTVDLSSQISTSGAGGTFMITWNPSSQPSDPSDPTTYEKAAQFTVPGTIQAASRTTGGQRCDSSTYFTLVNVTCVKGSCDLPSQMYTGAGFNRICYNRAYGLVGNASNSQCDWTMDGQGFKSLYLGNSGCHGTKGVSGTSVTNGNMAAIAIWRRSWVQLAKSISGNAGTVDLTSNLASMGSGGRIMITWNPSTQPSNPDNPDTYEKAVEFTVPGTLAGSSRTSGGQRCDSSTYFTLVNVTCVRGSCDLPSQMYTGTGFNRICYNRAYGLVGNSSNSQCDWGMDGQSFKSLYLGNSGCHGTKGVSGTSVTNGNMAAIAIWRGGAATTTTTTMVAASWVQLAQSISGNAGTSPSPMCLRLIDFFI